MGEIRNAERTRKAILQAAKEEFYDKGYRGARVEAIAKRAGCNKQLIYHYFKSKDQLINEVIDDFLTSLPQGNFALPANPVQIAEFRYKVNVEHLMDFLKYTAWEAIETIPENSNGAERRKKVLHSYVEDMSSKQEMGMVPPELDPALITLMISSLTIYPLLYSNVTRMITGYSAEDPEFQKQWAQFLHLISERIFEYVKPK
ncbi:TetR/AcrR family transcriptional regulator [Paenibacillus sp. sptzw28]|uniref:TetR/AcrR family transcriptional regulator n=1 Tax=Paenibacillus sp. sptzw28 TaxID=715179 RepID=UPI001C6EC018|nr:TetR/AcrR family transcriptional regulator [Paenibacillus sp. sptzw28]QYR21094.1 TetR/AcrR family transcriptional regulator [Paenibacillus sp. sptzw28]